MGTLSLAGFVSCNGSPREALCMRLGGTRVLSEPHTFWSEEVIMARGIVFPKPPLRANFVNKAKIESRN